MMHKQISQSDFNQNHIKMTKNSYSFLKSIVLALLAIKLCNSGQRGYILKESN
jgi:hypothetical protein